MKDVDQTLLAAIEALDIDAIRSALKGGADVHAYRDGRTLIGCCLDTTYPWPRLFESRVAWSVRLLLQAGAERDQPVDEGDEGTALHEVAMHGPYDVVEALLDARANPNLLCDGETALDIAEFDYWYHSMESAAGNKCGILVRADLPRLPLPDDDSGGDEEFERWTRWSQQQFIPLLRRRGARRASDRQHRPVKDGLWVDEDIRGGGRNALGCDRGMRLAVSGYSYPRRHCRVVQSVRQPMDRRVRRGGSGIVRLRRARTYRAAACTEACRGVETGSSRLFRRPFARNVESSLA